MTQLLSDLRIINLSSGSLILFNCTQSGMRVRSPSLGHWPGYHQNVYLSCLLLFPLGQKMSNSPGTRVKNIGSENFLSHLMSSRITAWIDCLFPFFAFLLLQLTLLWVTGSLISRRKNNGLKKMDLNLHRNKQRNSLLF